MKPIALTLSLSRLTGEGTAKHAFQKFRQFLIRRQSDYNSPSPILMGEGRGEGSK
jgi:hypothetical protein